MRVTAQLSIENIQMRNGVDIVIPLNEKVNETVRDINKSYITVVYIIKT